MREMWWYQRVAFEVGIAALVVLILNALFHLQLGTLMLFVFILIFSFAIDFIFRTNFDNLFGTDPLDSQARNVMRTVLPLIIITVAVIAGFLYL